MENAFNISMRIFLCSFNCETCLYLSLKKPHPQCCWTIIATSPPFWRFDISCLTDVFPCLFNCGFPLSALFSPFSQNHQSQKRIKCFLGDKEREEGLRVFIETLLFFSFFHARIVETNQKVSVICLLKT